MLSFLHLTYMYVMGALKHRLNESNNTWYVQLMDKLMDKKTFTAFVQNMFIWTYV